MILDAIVDEKRRVHATRDAAADRGARDRIAAAAPVRSLKAALRPTGRVPAVIAEFKRRSPSAGAIRDGGDAVAIAREYAAAGAAALSILTDEKFFGGSLADVTAVRAAVDLPVLRKDFVLFEEDLVDARLAGADAVLLIVRLLDDALLGALLGAAAALGLDALVEVHAESELRRALDCGARLVGINHRDLDTLAINIGLSEELAYLLPDDVVAVAESGLRTGDDVRWMGETGYDAVLVGESLLRADSPGAALQAMLDGAARSR